MITNKVDREFSRTDQQPGDGMNLLLQSYKYSVDAQADIWDFAVEIEMLLRSGMTVSDLVQLTTDGYVDHGRETSVVGDAHRSFQANDGLDFTPTTCFVLTERGAEIAPKLVKESYVGRF